MSEAHKLMKSPKTKYIRYALTVLIIGLVIWYFLSSNFDFKQTWIYLKEANYVWAFVPIPIMLLSHLLRAMRWQTMLKPIMKAKSIFNLFSAVMVGYAINNMIPRGGEFVRPYVYSKREKVSFSSVFATIIVERFLDIIFLLILFAGAFLILQERILSTLPENIDPKKVLFVVILFFVVVIFSFYPPLVRLMLEKTIKPVSQKFFDKFSEIFEKFAKGFAIIKTPGRYLRLVAESFGIWFCYALPMYFIFFSFNFQETANLGFFDALLLLIIGAIAITISPAPGGFGVYHGLLVEAMVNFYHINKEEALAYATVSHGVNFLVQVIVGLIFLFRENLKKLPHEEDVVEELESEPLKGK